MFPRQDRDTTGNAGRVLEAWTAADPRTPDEGLTVKQEIKAIHGEKVLPQILELHPRRLDLRYSFPSLILSRKNAL